MTELLSPRQIWLLAYENPLPKRFSSVFFKNIPTSPGVYWMLGEGGAVLYIGKAKNLRNRLRSYRQIKPDQSSRKSLRLVRLITEIRWEVCESEIAALLRENFLLRTYQPPFNVVNTHPENYYFIAFNATRESHLGFRLTTVPSDPSFAFQDELFGAFKGRGLIRKGYGSLVRLLWGALTPQSEGQFSFPSVLVRRAIPYRYEFLMDQNLSPKEKEIWRSLIRRFLRGSSKVLLQNLTEELLNKTNIHPFMYHVIQADLEILVDFFKYGPHRNRCLMRYHGLREPFLAQEKVDDLLVTYKRDPKKVFGAEDPDL